MAISILIMGESGTGKSTSLRTLDHKETFIINVLNKPLPFKGYKSKYVAGAPGSGKGNYLTTDNSHQIQSVISYISKNRPDIKNIIVDDFQYIMANEFMRRATESGWGKFSEIGQNAWSIFDLAPKCRDDLCLFFLSHTENNDRGVAKFKTIGKMLDEKISIEGMFTVVLHSLVTQDGYKFLTQHDANHLAKSPMGMFNDSLIDNDLKIVKDIIFAYFHDEETP